MNGPRPKNRKVKLVGGGHKWTRGGASTGSSSKSMRRSMRRRARNKDLTPTARKAIKEQIQIMLRNKGAR